MYAEVANVFRSTHRQAFHPVSPWAGYGIPVPENSSSRRGRRHQHQSYASYDNRRTLAGVGYEWLDLALERLHDNEPHEAQQALAAKRRLPVPGVSTEGIPVLAIWARTNTGRALSVVVRRVGTFDFLIIGASDLDLVELAVFEQWEEQQP
jgi:hypothetical protein